MDTGGVGGVIAQLDVALAAFQATPTPAGIGLAVEHLDRWARVLRAV